MFYLFHHIPKTAGTSCTNAFREMFNVVRDYHKSPSKEDLAEYAQERADLSSLGEDDLLVGHYHIAGHYLYQRYPDLDAFHPRKIIFFRDPLKTAISGVRYRIQNDRMKHSTVRTALLGRVGLFGKLLQCDEHSYQEVLDSYYFIGVLDTLQQSMDCFSRMSGKKRVQVPRLNKTTSRKLDLPQDIVDEFREKNTLDQMIFEYAQDKALSEYT